MFAFVADVEGVPWHLVHNALAVLAPHAGEVEPWHTVAEQVVPAVPLVLLSDA
jgi:hypothetical protein